MSAASYNFTIEQGATLRKQIIWKDGAGALINLTGYSAKMQIRKTVTSIDPLVELSTTNSKISLGTTNGTITLILSAADTADFDWTSGVYDLELTSADGVVTRLIQGTITVSRGVTR